MLSVHMTTLNGYVDSLKKLIANTEGFQINTTDRYGRTCLHAAACGG